MIVVNACKAAAVAIVGSLAFHSGRNMVQTRQVCRTVDSIGQGTTTKSLEGGPTTVEELQKMNRKELLELFVQQCEAPTKLSEIEGEWNGSLLKNNGLVSSNHKWFTRVCLFTMIKADGVPIAYFRLESHGS